MSFFYNQPELINFCSKPPSDLIEIAEKTINDFDKFCKKFEDKDGPYQCNPDEFPKFTLNYYNNGTTSSNVTLSGTTNTTIT